MKTGKRLRLLVWGAVGGILAAVLLYPQTRQVIGWQIQELDRPGNVPSTDNYRLRSEDVLEGFEKRATQAQKQDPLLQAQALAFRESGPSESLEELEKISNQHPESIPLLAMICIQASRGHLSSADQPHQSTDQTERIAWVEAIKNAAGRGVSLDPGNAFFALMLAAVLRESGDRAGFLEWIRRAGGADFYNDYTGVSAAKAVEYQRIANPSSSTLSAMVTYNSVFFPHFAVLRATTREAVEEAAKLEMAGNIQEGIRLRQSIMRAGSLMRRDGSSIITNLVGSDLVNTATGRPAGSPPQNEGSYNKEQTARDYARFNGFLKTNNAGTLAAAVMKEKESGELIRKILQTDMFGQFFDHYVSMVNHAAALVTFTAMFVLSVSLGLTGRWRLVAEAQPLPVGIRFGMRLAAILLFIGLSVLWVNYLGSNLNTGVFVLALYSLLSAAAVVLFAVVIRSLSSVKGVGVLPALGGFVGVIGFALLLAGPLATLVILREFMPFHEDWGGPFPVGIIASSVIMAALPVLAVIAGLVRRPFFSTAVRAGYSIAPVLLLISTTWLAAASIVTASQNRRLAPVLDAIILHEGRENARLAGLEWPEEIFIPKP